MCYLDEPIYANIRQATTDLHAIRLLTNIPNGKKGHQLKSIAIHFKEETCLIVLKKDSPKGPQVAFLEAYSLDDALHVMAHTIKSKRVRWHADKWVSMRSDKK